MRLKEPLFGARIALLHPTIHLSLAFGQLIQIYFIHLEGSGTRDPYNSEDEETTSRRLLETMDESLFSVDDSWELNPRNISQNFINFASTVSTTTDLEYMDPQALFWYMFIVHSICAIVMMIRPLIGAKAGEGDEQMYKRDKSFNEAKYQTFSPQVQSMVADFIQNTVCSIAQTGVIIYAIFRSKTEADWDTQAESDFYVGWISLEISVFFSWLFATGLFMAYCYIIGFNSFVKAESAKHELESVWQMKDSMDFLRYFFDEAIIWNMISYHIIQDAIDYFIYDQHNLGGDDYIQEHLLEAITVLARFFWLVLYIYTTKREKPLTTLVGNIVISIQILLTVSIVVLYFVFESSVDDLKVHQKFDLEVVSAPILLIYMVWSKRQRLINLEQQKELKESIALKKMAVDELEKQKAKDSKNMKAIFQQSLKKNLSKIVEEGAMNQVKQIIQHKKDIKINQDYTTLCILIFRKDIVESNKIDYKLMSNYVVYFSFVSLVQLGMIYSSTSEITNSDLDYDIKTTPYFAVLLVKQVCSLCLHMCLYPVIFRSMDLMKYVVNHHEDFTHSEIPIMIAFTSIVINIMAEILNIYMLLYWPSVEYSIIYFVALIIIVNIPMIYAESLVDDKIKDRVFKSITHLTVTKKNKDINFWKDRSAFNKCSRLLYKTFRLLYVGIIFYLQPFFVIFWYYQLTPGLS